MLNSFSGIGRLGADPVVTNEAGTMTASFNIGINEFFKSNDELQKKTHWIACICFGRLAEIAGEFLRKGSQIAVRGPLKSYTDDHSNYIRVNVLELEFLNNGRSQNETNPCN